MLFHYFWKNAASHLRCSIKSCSFKNFSIFTGRVGKHLCWSLFSIQIIAKFLRAPILKNICERLLLKMCSRNWKILKNFIRSFNFTLKKQVFLTSISETSECLFLFHDWFPMKFIFTYNISFGVVRNKLETLNIYQS